MTDVETDFIRTHGLEPFLCFPWVGVGSSPAALQRPTRGANWNGKVSRGVCKRERTSVSLCPSRQPCDELSRMEPPLHSPHDSLARHQPLRPLGLEEVGPEDGRIESRHGIGFQLPEDKNILQHMGFPPYIATETQTLVTLTRIPHREALAGQGRWHEEPWWHPSVVIHLLRRQSRGLPSGPPPALVSPPWTSR